MEYERYSRQSFLGPDAERRIRECVVGVVGLGGGGSHVVQQLAHIGFVNYVLYDPDHVEDSNLNRLVGANVSDTQQGKPKVDVAERMICGLQPQAHVVGRQQRWQDDQNHFWRTCDIIFGCVDGFAERRELEASARRYAIPYVDIGLDVHQVDRETPRMAGQVVLSMPRGPCLACLGAVTEKELAREARQYGAAGPRPQVVWANGILASAAVAAVVDLITDWTCSLRVPVYLIYDGNRGTLMPNSRLKYLDGSLCTHFPPDHVGPPVFRKPELTTHQ